MVFALTVFLVYCGLCNPAAPSLHWELVFPRSVIGEDLDCGKDISRLALVSHIAVQLEQVRQENMVQLQLDSILQKKWLCLRATSAQCTSEMELGTEHRHWDLSLWLNYKPVLCHEDLDKNCHWIMPVKHYTLALWWFLYCVFSSVYSHHPHIIILILAPTDLVAEAPWKYLKSDWVVWAVMFSQAFWEQNFRVNPMGLNLFS